MKKLLICLALGITIILCGCKSEPVETSATQGTENQTTEQVQDNPIDTTNNEKGDVEEMEQLKKPVDGEEVVIMMTSMGAIKMRLFPEVAPLAVENFKKLVTDGYYNGIIFHRVINDFMIQGGDPTGTGTGGESIYGKSFQDEFNLDYRNIRGALSMANSGPNTNGSQFFIVQISETPEDIISQMKELGAEKGFPEHVIKAYETLGGAYWLDMKHTVFGQVYEGMDIVDAIAAVPVDASSKPLEDVEILEATVVEYKAN